VAESAASGGARLSVVLPTLGNHELLRRVLDGYERQRTPAGSFEVIVVADRAEPQLELVRDALVGRAYPVRLLHGVVEGASGNRNVGWRDARAPIVLFTDNDTIPTRDLVAEHLSWHDRSPDDEVVVLGLVRWARRVGVTPFMRWLEHGIQFDYESIHGTVASWAHVYSSNCSVKRAFLEHVGGFDEQRLPYGYEDLDWGYRARDHGLRVLFNRRAVVDHWRAMTIQDLQVRAPRLAVSEWEFCRLHPDVAPWFWNKFRDAASKPQQGDLGARLTRLIPRGAPWVGPRVWRRADLYWRQQIAPHFLTAWAAAEEGDPPSIQPAASALAERSDSSGGS
jgi:GT2 family glycosyltransferase